MPSTTSIKDSPRFRQNLLVGSVRELVAKGLRVVPIPLGEKSPKLKDWANLEIGENNVEQYFGEQGNVGVILGHNGLTDIDKDCDEAVRIAHIFLPETGMEFGRRSARSSHSLYYCDPPLPTKTFKDPLAAKKNTGLLKEQQEKATIIEIRGTKADGSLGSQSVFPPSVHPSGEDIEYEPGRDGTPQNVDAEQIERAVARIAAAVLLSRHMPPVNGGRNECFMAIEGKLVRSGWPREEVRQFSMAIRTILYGKNVNASMCEQMLDHAHAEHEAGRQMVGLPRLKELVPPVAVSRAFEWLGISGDEAGGLPTVILNDFKNHEASEKTLEILKATNDPAFLFVTQFGLSTVGRSLDGDRPVILNCSDDYVRTLADQRVFYARRTKDKEENIVLIRISPPPIQLVRDLVSRPLDQLGLPALLGITETPFITSGGRIVSEAGYDVETRLLYAEPPGFKLGCIPDKPAERDAQNACKWLLDELLVNFPFVDTASRHNALAGILTAIIRSTLDGIAPLFLIDATVAGTGKSLVAELVSIIATGRVAVMGGMPDREDEFAKALTSSLLANPTGIVIFDNIAGSLASPTLARALTASTFSERLLGSNRKADIQHRACFFANGNNVDVRGDIGRRVCYSRMDAGVTDPHKRGGFRHEDIKAWAHSNRGLILAKLLTMCKAWHVAGRPAPKNLVMGSFERWIKTVGGIMQFAGASEFMRNADEFLESSDSERDDWEGFLARLFCLFRKSEKAVITRQFTVKEVMDKTRTSQDLSEVVPGCMADYLEKGLAGKKSIGKVFSYRKSRRFGKQGLRLVISSKASPARWVVQSDSPVVLGNYTDPDGRGMAWSLTPSE